MRQLLKLLVRLYPSAWRKRYGQEFEVLLDDVKPSLGYAADICLGAFKMQLKNSSWIQIVLLCAAAGAFLGIALSFRTPVKYESEAMFFVTAPSKISQDQIPYNLGEKALSDDTLATIIRQHNLYPNLKQQASASKAISEMRRSIHLLPTPNGAGDSATNNFVLRFDYLDPTVAKTVNDELVRAIMQASFEMGSRPTFNIRLFKMSSLPDRPLSSNRLRAISVGLIVGLFSGTALAWINRRPHTAFN